MLSDETIERYRRMTTGERLAMTFDAISDNLQAMGAGSVEHVARRYELLRRTNIERNGRVLFALESAQGES